MEEQELRARSGGRCELCGDDAGLGVYRVPHSEGQGDADILVCSRCRPQLEGELPLEENHWRCLSDSMWSPVPAVQVQAWRLLKRLSAETWAQDLLDMLYLDEDVRQWAEQGAPLAEEDRVVQRDCNGVELRAGDTVTVIKDLDVKGTSIVAKRGTAVRGISLTDNPEQIEGRVNGQRIVILTRFVKKSG